MRFMAAKVYLLGTVHILPIDKIIKDLSAFENLMRDMEVTIIEAPVSKPTTKTKLKAPALYLGLFIYYIFSKTAKWINNVISKRGNGDRDSFMLFLNQKIKRDISKIDLEQLTPKANSSSINIVPCYDADLNKDVNNKGFGYIIINYIALVILIILLISGVGSILINKSNFVSYIFIALSIFIPFEFFTNYIEKNNKLAERNNIAVNYCKEVINKGYTRILLFYGNEHILDINQKLKNSQIETEVIDVEIPKFLKSINAVNKKIRGY